MISEATWIWYPGDYEIWLGNNMNNRRTERGAIFPPFWKTDSHYVTVEFSKDIDLKQPEEIVVAAEGIYNIKLDGKLQFGMPTRFLLPEGKHKICIKVHNQATPPALYVKGETVRSGADWKVTYEDKEWIDESGKASDTSATLYMNVGYWNFNSPEQKPSLFKLSRERKSAVRSEAYNDGVLIDFGLETFGYIVLKGLAGTGVVDIFYGESREEATDKEHCETLDKIEIGDDTITDLAKNTSTKRTADYTLESSKAFRYVYVETDKSLAVDEIAMDYEFLPVEYRGKFTCNDEEMNRIWRIGAYTMHVTTREFFIDGIKRDRWVWSGDAVQSYLMNYYLFFDSETVKRTIWLLRGKDPVTSHVNTIMDYSFYWLNSIADYYLYTGDESFVAQVYPRMRTLMDYILSRTNAEGMVEGQNGDWVFVDWADFPMSKRGALAFEQILLCRSLESMKTCAGVIGEDADKIKYGDLADSLRSKLLPTFWNDDKHAIMHNVEDGKLSEQVNKFPNMFAITMNYLDEKGKAVVMENVILNNDVPKITTPYMRFYELEAMCAMGYQERVMREMKEYWGGMLKEGATTFWEKYNPEDNGSQHLSMYGRPYGKSLCHAWGASPIYLLGKYYLGVRPTLPGYEEYEVCPSLGGLEWMEGDVPAPFGNIHVRMNSYEVSVKSDGGKGTLIIGKKRVSIPVDEEITIRYKE